MSKQYGTAKTWKLIHPQFKFSQDIHENVIIFSKVTFLSDYKN